MPRTWPTWPRSAASWVALVLPSLDRDAALAAMDDYAKLLVDFP